MQGSLGIGANLNKWSRRGFHTRFADGRAITKSIRQTVQQGKLYRLFSPRRGDLTANQYVSEDGKQAVLFAFLPLAAVPAACSHGLSQRPGRQRHISRANHR